MTSSDRVVANLLVAGACRDLWLQRSVFFDINRHESLILGARRGVYCWACCRDPAGKREAQLSAGAKSRAQFIGEITLTTSDHPFVGHNGAKAGMFPGHEAI